MPYIGKEPEHGNYQLLDALTLPSGVFDGSRTVFNLTADGVAVYPTSPTTLIISLGGVLQEPNSSYTVSGNQITFTTAPATSTTFFGVSLGDTLDIGTPSDDSVDSQHYVDGSIDSAHIADDAVTYAKMQNLGTADRVLGSVSTGVIGEVQIVPDMLATNAVTNVKVATGIDAIKLADGTVTNAELQYINSLSSNAQTQLDAKLTSSTKIDDLTAGDDNTDLDSSTSRHGLLLKLGGGTTNFLRADGAWAAAGGGIASVAADTSPQLGGSLDAQNNTILNVGNANSDWTAGTLSIATSGGVFLNMDTYSTTANEASNINLRRSKNATLGSFSQVVANESMGTINFQGSTSSGFTGGPTISGISTESRTSSAGGSKLEIKTIANSSTTPVLAMTIDQNAEVTVKENASMPSVTQGIAKAWIKWSTSGSSSGSIVGHHGWSSISYGGATGDSDHTMGVTFTSFDKQVFTAVTDDARIVCIGTSSTTTVTTRVYVVSSSGLAGSDVGRNMMAVFGELA